MPQQRKHHPVLWILGAVVALIVVIGVAGAIGGSATDNGGSGGGRHGGISQGIGANNAAGDVQVGPLRVDTQFGVKTYSAAVLVTNHSSGRSDYVITLALESADGKTQIDTADVFIQNLEAGQSKQESGDFLSASLGSAAVPADAKVVVQEVERTASI